MKNLTFLIPWLLTCDSIFCQTDAPSPKRYRTAEGHIMIIITGPVSFIMGSPENEAYRDTDEVQHKVTIPRSFAIDTKEITIAQFQRFLDNNPAIRQLAKADADKDPSRDNKKLLRFSPNEQCPQILVTWYEAAQYCNWLSKQEGIPQKEWVYPPPDQIKSGMVMPKDYLKRTGYRLPTEAEWEFACRANTTSSRFFGSSNDRLADYAWYSKKPPQQKGDTIDAQDPHHTYPVAQLQPNQFGLFDVYGNVWEWCQSRRLPYSRDAVEDTEDIPAIITDSTAMIRRGGSFAYGKEVMRSAHRGATNYFPMQRRDNVGFRIARTMRQ
jgi:formylglycine-generating enzyme required for sulfatase activity